VYNSFQNSSLQSSEDFDRDYAMIFTIDKGGHS